MKRFWELFTRLVQAVEQIAQEERAMNKSLEDEIAGLHRELHEHIASKRHSNTPKRKKAEQV